MFSFASIKAVIAHVFGIGEDKAHSLVEAVIADALPVLAQLRTDITNDFVKLAGEAKADAGALYAEVLADVKTELAAIKALINPAPAQAQAPAPASSDVPVTDPAAPTA